MTKFFSFLFIAAIFLLSSPFCQASQNSFVSIVNPIRGGDFWELKNQQPETIVSGQVEILRQFNVNSSWLLRFDALINPKIIDILNSFPQSEKGLFLEVTPTWSKQASVTYHQTKSWHWAGSAFLTGYDQAEREKLIDSAFEKFKDVFGYYPISVGAWWIDSYSLSYMQKKYRIIAALIVADQYSTDNYQIWGQYWSTPFYPAKRNALIPAQSLENKIPVVVMQWASRDPINGYGNGVFESTFSVQANDYIDYHDLNTSYFSNLVDIFTNNDFNNFSHLVVGLENSYLWDKYNREYFNQIRSLVEKSNNGQLAIVSMKEFAAWYQNSFPNLSPTQIIIATDPLKSERRAVWFMNPYYRAGWFYNENGSIFRDIRQYVEGSQELCFDKRCGSVNFATSATRVLDEVSFGHRWVIDEGKIKKFDTSKKDNGFLITYENESGKKRLIEFLPRDIAIDGNILSIDKAILDATRIDLESQVIKQPIERGFFKWSSLSVLSKIIKFILFLIFGCIIPGLLLINKPFIKSPFLLRIFLSTVVGLVSLTVIFYIVSLLKLRSLMIVYLLMNTIAFVLLKPNLFKIGFIKIKNWFHLSSITIIVIGTIFQVIPTFKSGLLFPFGLGFWGPNTHDGIWHISLINSLVKSVPPENPIFSGTILKNYHFFYDLLITLTSYLTQLPILDLVFRFYPVLFSTLLGIGTYYLTRKLFEQNFGILKTKVAILISLYLVYFAGSFGWIVSYIKERIFAGESAFWANQSISFNLNPPFAISLVIIIAFLNILFSLPKLNKNGLLIQVILIGSLIGFKAYGAFLILTTLLILGLIRRQISFLILFISSSIISVLIFLTNFQTNTALLIFAPFWFIHSMIDSPDRVGWIRLTLAREVGFVQRNWFKFISAEILGLMIFIVGNLGLRVFSLASLIKIKSVRDEKYLFILIFSTFSFLIPILFIQSGNPWNTIQFTYYGLYTTAIVSGLILSLILFNLPRFLSILTICAVIILAPINSVVTASYYTTYHPHAKVSTSELEALDFLSKQKDGIVLTYPYDEKLKQKIAEPWSLFIYDSTAYVGAFSKKAVFVEDVPQNQILLNDYKKRIVASKDFFSMINSTGEHFLKENKIKYIYLPRLFSLSLDQNKLHIKSIFENNEVIIYEVEDDN